MTAKRKPAAKTMAANRVASAKGAERAAHLRKSAPRKPPAAKKAPAKRAAAPGKAGALHQEREDHPWSINIPEHQPRTDSPLYVKSRALLKTIVSQATDITSFLGGDPSYEDHHGGGFWVMDDTGWLFIKNLAGMEWSQQFCADPAKVEKLRAFAERVYAAFPKSIPALQKLAGADYPLENLLKTPIRTAKDVAQWVDSIFNASVPLDKRRHTGALLPTGTVPASDPKMEAGVHHYPTPITDIQIFKYDDFQLWVVDSEGHPAAVTPAHPRGSGRSEMNVAYATPGSKLHKQLLAAHSKNQELQIKGSDRMAKQAFAAQK